MMTKLENQAWQRLRQDAMFAEEVLGIVKELTHQAERMLDGDDTERDNDLAMEAVRNLRRMFGW